jgi:vacuolar-type H+-ATPase subunit I/STV1
VGDAVHAATMKPARVEALVWVLIYGGLLMLSLGTFVVRQIGDEGRVIAIMLFVAGGLAVIAGAVLVVVRARMPDPTSHDT